jgi:hypothetical protein
MLPDGNAIQMNRYSIEFKFKFKLKFEFKVYVLNVRCSLAVGIQGFILGVQEVDPKDPSWTMIHHLRTDIVQFKS